MLVQLKVDSKVFAFFIVILNLVYLFYKVTVFLSGINLIFVDQTFQIDFFFYKHFKSIFYFFYIIITLFWAIHSDLEHILIEFLYFLELSWFNILILKHLLKLFILFTFLKIVFFVFYFQTLLEKILVGLYEIHINVKLVIIWLIFIRFAKIFIKYTALKRYFLKIFWDFDGMLLKSYWENFDFEFGSRGILYYSLSFPFIWITGCLYSSIENALNVFVCSSYLIKFSFVYVSGLLGICAPVYVANNWVIGWTHSLTTIFYI